MGEMRGVCLVGGSGSEGVNERGCKCQHTERVPRNSPHVARSWNRPSTSPRKRFSVSCAYAVGISMPIRLPLTCPPVAFTGLHVSWTQRAARVSKRPHRPMPFGAHVGHIIMRCSCLGRPAHSPSRCWNSETLRPKQSSTLGQEVRASGLIGRPGNLLERGNWSPRQITRPRTRRALGKARSGHVAFAPA